MPKFLEGDTLNLEIANIFKNARVELILISPFIKLHHRLRDILKDKINDHKLKITLLIGKNENNIIKSIPKEEVDFFKDFPNIEIRYEERLHAKYYSNENSSVITSMNLYDYSADHNIEVGIQVEPSLLDFVKQNESIGTQAFYYFDKVLERSELLFKKEPVYTKGKLGLGKKYQESVVTENKIEELVKVKKSFKPKPETQKTGFCIKCGEEIKIDPKKPYCYKHYKEWAKNKDVNQKENYCHTCGEKNQPSIKYPSCRTCYRDLKNQLEYPKL